MNTKKKAHILFKILKIASKTLAVIFALLLLVVVLINIPAVQTYITQQVSEHIREDYGIDFGIGGVKIAIPNTVQLEEIFIPGKEADTLLYLDNLSVDVALFALLQNHVNVRYIGLDGLKGNVFRGPPGSDYNFNFLLEAFASDTTTTEVPDTTASSWTFTVGRIALSDVDARFRDEILGLDAGLNLGSLDIDIDRLLLDKPSVLVGSLALENTRASLTMWNAPGSDTDSTERGYGKIEKKSQPSNDLPDLGIKTINLANINFTYKDSTSGMVATVDLGEFLLESESINLPEKSVRLEEIELSETTARLTMASEPVPAPEAPAGEEASGISLQEQLNVLPGWDLRLANVDLEDLAFEMTNNNAPENPCGLDFNNLKIKHLALSARNAVFNDEEKSVQINRLNFEEAGGFSLDDFAVNARLRNDLAEVNALRIGFGKTEVRGDFKAGFENPDMIIRNPGKTTVDVNISKSILHAGDLFYLSSISPSDTALWPYRDVTVNLNLDVTGRVDHLNVDDLYVSTPGNTSVQMKGLLENATDPGRLRFDLDFDTIRSSKHDLAYVLDSTTLAEFNMPEDFLLQLSASGTTDSVHVDTKLSSAFGNLTANAFYHTEKLKKRDTVNLELALNQLDPGKFLNDTTIGPVTLNISAAGANIIMAGLPRALAIGTIREATFNGYTYRDINLELNAGDSLATLEIKSADPNADFTLNASSTMDTTKHQIDAELAVELLNLYALNLSKEKFGLKTNIGLEGYYTAADNLKGCVNIRNTSLAGPEKVIPVDRIEICPTLKPDSTNLVLNSKVASLNLQSNMALDELETVMSGALGKYFGQPDTLQLPPGKNLNLNADISLTERLRAFLLPGLNDLIMDTITANYQSDNNALQLSIRAPEINYSNVIVDAFMLEVSGREDSLMLEAGYENLRYDSLFTGPFALSTHTGNAIVNSSVSLKNPDGQLRYLLRNTIDLSGDSTRISFAENGLMLNTAEWEVPPENALIIANSVMRARNFVFSHAGQKIGVDLGPEVQKFTAGEFELANLLGILMHPHGKQIVKGRLDGTVRIPVQKNYSGIQADLAIHEFRFFDSLIGDMSFNLKEETEELNLIFKLQNSENSISAEGSIGKSESPQPISLETDIDIRAPEKLETLSLGSVSNTSGTIRGKISVAGNTEDPDITGSLNFIDTRMKINMLNLEARLPDEKIVFNQQGMAFDNFTVYDASDSKMVINGNLKTTDYSDFAFDLNLSAKGFQPINSTRADNETFWGKLMIDTDIKLTGDMNLPVVDADLTILGGTDLTYALPGSEIEMVSSEGIVEFTTPEVGLDTLFGRSQNEKYLTDSIMRRISGIDLSAQIGLDPEATFTVMIDPSSGDYASVSGSANLNLSIDPSGTQTLTGIFEVRDGIYQLSFYGLVKKTFEFQPGSTIAWSGRPMDANMDFSAKYVVRTQSLPLVSNESAGLTEAEKNMFRQRLPFEVILNLNGFLDEPKVNFAIDLPEKFRVNYPQVSSKLNMLNAEQNESELNKQVFALLVTGSFIADNPFASSGGSVESFATTAARNSVNGILADQLNKLSSRYVKGVQMNFGLTTYEDYGAQGSDTRTELDVQVSKKLLDERLTIEATGSFDVEGSRQYTSTATSYTYGEFSATYDLTKNGEYKLRAYRENAYDLFDGEIAYNGLSFIFERSFNSLFKRRNKENESRGNITDMPENENNNSGDVD